MNARLTVETVRQIRSFLARIQSARKPGGGGTATAHLLDYLADVLERPAAYTEPVDPPEPAEVPEGMTYRGTQPVETDPFGEAADSDYETTESPPLDRHYRGLPRPRRWY